MFRASQVADTSRLPPKSRDKNPIVGFEQWWRVEVGRTFRIRRWRAGRVDDTTDAIRAVACIRFSPLVWPMVLILWFMAIGCGRLHGIQHLSGFLPERLGDDLCPLCASLEKGHDINVTGDGVSEPLTSVCWNVVSNDPVLH